MVMSFQSVPIIKHQMQLKLVQNYHSNIKTNQHPPLGGTGDTMKDYKGEWKDLFWGAVAAILMLAPAMFVYVWKTGGVS